jgi:uncharacterized protein (DUF1778 family)
MSVSIIINLDKDVADIIQYAADIQKMEFDEFIIKCTMNSAIKFINDQHKILDTIKLKIEKYEK